MTPNPEDSVSLNAPLLLRLLELAGELKTDVQLHMLAEDILAAAREGRGLNMEDYPRLSDRACSLPAAASKLVASAGLNVTAARNVPALVEEALGAFNDHIDVYDVDAEGVITVEIDPGDGFSTETVGDLHQAMQEMRHSKYSATLNVRDESFVLYIAPPKDSLPKLAATESFQEVISSGPVAIADFRAGPERMSHHKKGVVYEADVTFGDSDTPTPLRGLYVPFRKKSLAWSAQLPVKSLRALFTFGPNIEMMPCILPQNGVFLYSLKANDAKKDEVKPEVKAPPAAEPKE